MKRYIIIFATLFFTLCAFAQNSEYHNFRKEYREGEIKFIKAQNIMSDAEFESFTTIYNNYKEARSKVRQENKAITPEEGKELTDEQAAYNIQAKITKQEKFAKLYKEYIESLQTRLTNKQILLIDQAQKKYKKIKFKELRDDSVKAVENLK